MRTLFSFLALAAASFGATGNVVLQDTQLGTSTDGTNSLAKMFDGLFSTFYNGGTGDWGGMKATVPVTIEYVKYSPRVVGTDWDRTFSTAGVQVQTAGSCSSPSTFGTPTIIDTYPSAPTPASYLGSYVFNAPLPATPQGVFTNRVLGTNPTSQCFRVIATLAQPYASSPALQMQEMEFVVAAGAGGFGARPADPVLSPYGAHDPSARIVTVTLSSETTSATMYYTTDGSTPTTSSSHVAEGGTVTLTLSFTPITLSVLAYDASLSTPASPIIASAQYSNFGFKVGDSTAVDEQGHPLNLTAGDFNLSVDGYWYAWGMNWSTVAISNEGILSHGTFLYRSADLYNWSQVTNGTLGNNFIPAGADGTVDLERTRIHYNPNTAKYVAWSHSPKQEADLGFTLSNNVAGYALANVATSSFIDHGYTWVYSTPIDPSTYYGQNYLCSDMNFFVDPNSNIGYLIYSATHDNFDLIVQQLDSTWTVPTSTFVVAYPGTGREAPVMFARNGTYFLISSVIGIANTDYAVGYQTASSPLGTWSGLTPLFAADPFGTAYNGQPAAVFQLPYKTDGWVIWFDQFQNTPVTELFLPLTFSDNTHVQAQTLAWDATSYFANTYTSQTQLQGVTCSKCTVR